MFDSAWLSRVFQRLRRIKGCVRSFGDALVVTFTLLFFSACAGSGGGGAYDNSLFVASDGAAPGEVADPLAANENTGQVNVDDPLNPDRVARAKTDVEALIQKMRVAPEEGVGQDTLSRKRHNLAQEISALGVSALPAVVVALQSEYDAEIKLELLFVRRQLFKDAEDKGVDISAFTGGKAGDQPSGNLSDGTPESGESGSTGSTAANGDRPRTVSDEEAYNVLQGLEDTSFNPAEVDKFVIARLVDARRLIEQGRNGEAEDVCQALLLLLPRSQHRQRVVQVLEEARRTDRSRASVMARMVFSQPYASFSSDGNGKLASPVELVIFITNIGRFPIELTLGEESGERQGLLTLDLELTERTALGKTNQLSTMGRLQLSVTGGPFRISPDATWEYRQSIDDLSSVSNGLGLKQVVSEVTVSGTLRPTMFVVEKSSETGKALQERMFSPISITRGTMYVLPADFPVDMARVSPVEVLKSKITKAEWTQLHLLAPFFKSQHTKDALDALLAPELERAGLTEREARLRLAAILSEREYSADVAAWRQWWLASRFRY